MRGKLVRAFRQAIERPGLTTGSVASEDKEAFVSRVSSIGAMDVGLAAVLLAVRCHAQGNIDAGKTPGANLRRHLRGAATARRVSSSVPSAGFLRQHYTAGSDEASAMAGYLAGLPQPNRARAAAAQPQPQTAAGGR